MFSTKSLCMSNEQWRPPQIHGELKLCEIGEESRENVRQRLLHEAQEDFPDEWVCRQYDLQATEALNMAYII